MTGERIRDKIAASKAKGMWMGGTPPLGYDLPTDPVTRALVVNPEEAEQVRSIFGRYLELRSVSALAGWLQAAGIRSKAWTTRAGRSMGGMPCNRGALFHLLANRTYLGDITHKQASYPGAHAAIVPTALFDEVQALLSANRTTHHRQPTKVSAMALRGIIFDADGQPMSPTFAHGRQGRVYRYYVSAPFQQGRRQPASAPGIRRVPATAIEELVLDRLQSLPRGRKVMPLAWPEARALLGRVEIHVDELHLVMPARGLFAAHADLGREVGRLGALIASDQRVLLEEGDGTPTIRLIVPAQLRLRGGRTWITNPKATAALAAPKVDRALVRGLCTARGLIDGMTPDQSLDGQQRKVRTPVSAYDRALCRLAFLAPDIQRVILEGRQPPGFNLQQLVHGEIPVDWADQRVLFGFDQPPA